MAHLYFHFQAVKGPVVLGEKHHREIQPVKSVVFGQFREAGGHVEFGFDEILIGYFVDLRVTGKLSHIVDDRARRLALLGHGFAPIHPQVSAHRIQALSRLLQ